MVNQDFCGFLAWFVEFLWLQQISQEWHRTLNFLMYLAKMFSLLQIILMHLHASLQLHVTYERIFIVNAWLGDNRYLSLCCWRCATVAILRVQILRLQWSRYSHCAKQQWSSFWRQKHIPGANDSRSWQIHQNAGTCCILYIKTLASQRSTC